MKKQEAAPKRNYKGAWTQVSSMEQFLVTSCSNLSYSQLSITVIVTFLNPSMLKLKLSSYIDAHAHST